MNGQELFDSCKGEPSCEVMLPIIRDLGEDITIIEIGVSRGLGMWRMLTKCPNISHAYGIDPWTSYGNDSIEIGIMHRAEAIEVLKPFNTLTLIHDTSDNAVELFADNSIDYVFIDGDHSYEQCGRDIINYFPKVKQGGILAGHDYKGGETGVKKAVNKFKSDRNVVTTERWCWYHRKEYTE